MAADKIYNYSIYWFGKRSINLTVEEHKCYKRNMMRKHLYNYVTTPEESIKSLTGGVLYKHRVPIVVDGTVPIMRMTSRGKEYQEKWDVIQCCCGCEITTLYSGQQVERHMTTNKHKNQMKKTGNKERSVIYLVDSQWKFTDKELLHDVTVSGAV